MCALLAAVTAITRVLLCNPHVPNTHRLKPRLLAAAGMVHRAKEGQCAAYTIDNKDETCCLPAGQQQTSPAAPAPQSAGTVLTQPRSAEQAPLELPLSWADWAAFAVPDSAIKRLQESADASLVTGSSLPCAAVTLRCWAATASCQAVPVPPCLAPLLASPA